MIHTNLHKSQQPLCSGPQTIKTSWPVEVAADTETYPKLKKNFVYAATGVNPFRPVSTSHFNLLVPIKKVCPGWLEDVKGWHQCYMPRPHWSLSKGQFTQHQRHQLEVSITFRDPGQSATLNPIKPSHKSAGKCTLRQWQPRTKLAEICLSQLPQERGNPGSYELRQQSRFWAMWRPLSM